MSEHGDRGVFLARIRERQGRPATSGPHPPPPAPDTVPTLRYKVLDDVDPTDHDALLEVFVAAATGAEAEVDVVDGHVPSALLAELVERHGVRNVTHSTEPLAVATASAIEAFGCRVAPYERVDAAAADLSVTSATHAVAATGSVVVDSRTAGSRAVSLVAPVHLCVVPIESLVADHAAVLRDQQRPMPSCRVLVTGPSRTGDIEQRLTLGAHGPVALHIVVVRSGTIG